MSIPVTMTFSYQGTQVLQKDGGIDGDDPAGNARSLFEYFQTSSLARAALGLTNWDQLVVNVEGTDYTFNK